MAADFLDGRPFYELCQAYRHVGQHSPFYSEADIVTKFEALKDYIREHINITIEECAALCSTTHSGDAVRTLKANATSTSKDGR